MIIMVYMKHTYLCDEIQCAVNRIKQICLFAAETLLTSSSSNFCIILLPSPQHLEAFDCCFMPSRAALQANGIFMPALRTRFGGDLPKKHPCEGGKPVESPAQTGFYTEIENDVKGNDNNNCLVLWYLLTALDSRKQQSPTKYLNS
jgi:hypothetical protein